MPRRRIAVLAAAVVLSLAASAPILANAPMGQREIEESLTCQCGCGLTVAACNHLQCGFAVPVRKDIAESLARGDSGEQIIERYKHEYGEKVLSSPVPEGFNLLAWIAPYLAIVLAGLLMFTFFRRRALAVPEVPRPTAEEGPVDERIATLRREVEELER